MIFDMNTGKLAHEVQAHRSPVLGMDNHPRNSMFVSCSMDKDNPARVWRRESHFSGREGDPDIRPAAPIVAAPDPVVPPVRQSTRRPAPWTSGNVSLSARSRRRRAVGRCPTCMFAKFAVRASRRRRGGASQTPSTPPSLEPRPLS